MTCPSCHFENMKTARVCGRCGAILVWTGPRLRNLLRPPRAGGGRLYKALRRRMTRLASRFRSSAFAETFSASSFACVGRMPAEAMVTSVSALIPGLGYLILNERLYARISFLGWLFFFLIGMLAPRIDHRIAAFCFMFALHLYTVFDVVRPGQYCRSEREMRLLVCLIVLATAAVNGAAFWGLGSVFGEGIRRIREETGAR